MTSRNTVVPRWSRGQDSWLSPRRPGLDSRSGQWFLTSSLRAIYFWISISAWWIIFIYALSAMRRKVPKHLPPLFSRWLEKLIHMFSQYWNNWLQKTWWWSGIKHQQLQHLPNVRYAKGGMLIRNILKLKITKISRSREKSLFHLHNRSAHSRLTERMMVRAHPGTMGLSKENWWFCEGLQLGEVL